MSATHKAELVLWHLLAFSVVMAVLHFGKTIVVDRWRYQQCYLLNYKLFKAPKDWMLDLESSMGLVVNNKNLRLPEYRFLQKTVARSGIGEYTSVPPTILAGRKKELAPATLTDTLTEIDQILFSTLDQIFQASGFQPKEIDILVLNVTIFAPMPSITSRIINHYHMREDVKVYNLSGMGCSSSLVSIYLVQQLFKVYKNSLAIVVSTEALSPYWYRGKERSMMLSNCLFRSGGCSMLLTNNRALKKRALFMLKHCVRTHIGADDKAYSCCIGEEDDLGYRGYKLSKHLPDTVVKAMTENFKVLLPKILPVWELVRFVAMTTIISKIFRQRRFSGGVPDLRTGIDHFCFHPGGRAVIDKIGSGLGLPEFDLEPIRMSLHRFGNSTSSSIWYVLGYMEAKKRLRMGDKILMLSLGAGFKCNTCVWEVLKDLEDRNVWDDIIDTYPRVSDVNPFEEKFGWINDEKLELLSEQDFDHLVENFLKGSWSARIED